MLKFMFHRYNKFEIGVNLYADVKYQHIGHFRSISASYRPIFVKKTAKNERKYLFREVSMLDQHWNFIRVRLCCNLSRVKFRSQSDKVCLRNEQFTIYENRKSRISRSGDVRFQNRRRHSIRHQILHLYRRFSVIFDNYLPISA